MIKNQLQIIVLILSVFFFCGCEKQKIKILAEELKGTWKINEFMYKIDYKYKINPRDSLFVDAIARMQNLNDLKSTTHTLEFFQTKNAYTSVLKGVYKIDYSDASLKDNVDTFDYTLSKNVLTVVTISSLKINASSLPGSPKILPLFPLPKFRFRLDEYKGENLSLNGSPYLLNDTCYYKATRLN